MLCVLGSVTLAMKVFQSIYFNCLKKASYAYNYLYLFLTHNIHTAGYTYMLSVSYKDAKTIQRFSIFITLNQLYYEPPPCSAIIWHQHRVFAVPASHSASEAHILDLSYHAHEQAMSVKDKCLKSHNYTFETI